VELPFYLPLIGITNFIHWDHLLSKKEGVNIPYI